jgi:type II secretory ATPase GspE/PulE/Tfp pilus assembly ATPase PilB-like protein
MLDFNQQMRDVVLETPTIHKIHEIAKQGLFMTLQGFGFQLVSQGVTAFDEIERVAGSE